MTSPDGVTWTARTSAADNSWGAVTYGNGHFVAVSTIGTGDRVMTSSDGITWRSRTTAIENSWRSVTFGDGKMVAVATTGFGNQAVTISLTAEDNTDSQSQASTSTESAAREAAAIREAERQAARAAISIALMNFKEITIEMFNKAEIVGITPENVEEVQAEIKAIPEVSRVDISQVIKIARKYEIVGMVASDRVVSIYSNSLIEIGLISADSKHKAALTEAIKNLPEDERSSYAAIKEALDAKMAEIQARKDRLTAILALIASHTNG
jgi:hypothetical protein